MELYIKGVGCISPQLTSENSVFLPEIKEYNTAKMLCIDPDYTKFFDHGFVRRMGRLAKFGTAAALIALRDAKVEKPGAISTGTGYGLLENSEKFLRAMIAAKEDIASPTAFIQSTHNTVSGAVALITGCNAHNNTFSHKGFSFESTLIDARLLFAESDVDDILVGAYEEISEVTYAIMERLHAYRSGPCNNLQLYNNPDEGVMAGEGAAFFVLSPNKSENDYARFADNTTFSKPANLDEVKQRVNSFLEKNNLALDEIDIVLTGMNGEKKRDDLYQELNRSFFNASTIAAYKHLCGEYMTASSFAFWLAARMIKEQQVPDTIVLNDMGRKPKIVLLYNTYRNNHSLMLFKAD